MVGVGDMKAVAEVLFRKLPLKSPNLLKKLQDQQLEGGDTQTINTWGRSGHRHIDSENRNNVNPPSQQAPAELAPVSDRTSGTGKEA